MAELDKLEIKVSTNAASAQKKLDKLIDSLSRLKGMSDFGALTSSMNQLAESVERLSKAGLTKAISNAARSADKLNSRLANSAAAANTDRMAESTQEMADALNEVQSIPVSEQLDATAQGAESAAEKTDRLSQFIGKAVDGAGRLGERFKAALPAIGSGLKSVADKIGGILGQIGKMLKMRIYRLIAKQIIDGFVTGINNAYQWASIMGNQFASSMDSLATSALYLKNSLGAMMMPLINAVAPAIDYVVDKFVDLLNIANRVFAMLTGAKTWTKAEKYPTQFAAATDAATGSAKKLQKELLTILGIDEINPLDSQNEPSTGSGGGSAAAQDYSSMFTEVPLENATGFFADIAAATKDFMDNLDLEPLQKAWEKVSKPIKEIVDNIKSGLLWGYKNVVLPIAKWLAESAVPEILNTIASALTVINDIIVLLKPTAKWIFDNILKPIGSALGQTIIATLKKAQEYLNKIHLFLKGIQDIINGDWKSGIANLKGALGIGSSGTKSTVFESIWKGMTTAVPGLKAVSDLFNLGKFAFQVTADVTDAEDKIPKSQKTLSSFIANLFKFTEGFTGTSKDKKISGFGAILASWLTGFTGPSKDKKIGGFSALLASWFASFTGNSKDRKLTGFQSLLSSWSTNYSGAYKNLQLSGWMNIFNTWGTNYTGNSKNRTIGSFISKFTTWVASFTGTAKDRVIGGFTAKIQDFITNILDMLIPGFKARLDSVKDNIPNKVINGFQIGVTGIKTDGATYSRIATGGAFYNGNWHSIPQYASGTLNAGSMFVAGEAGPELVGHVGSRTEVLNQSQLAATMAASMSQANEGQRQLLASLLNVAQQIAENQGNGTVVSTSELVGGLQRLNRRDGRVVVATGV